MPTTEETLTTRLADLRAQVEAVDLSSVQREATAAEAAHESAKRACHGLDGRQLENHSTQQAFGQLKEAGLAATNARYNLGRAGARVRELMPEIQKLTRLLGGKSRAAAAAERASVADELVASAMQATRKAEATLSSIATLIKDEERALETATANAADALLKAVKGGGDVAAVPAASRDKLSSMELARATAQQELEACRAALKAAAMSKESASKEILEARADMAELAHEIAFSNYLETLIQCMKDCDQARRPLPVQDARSLAFDAIHRRG